MTQFDYGTVCFELAKFADDVSHLQLAGSNIHRIYSVAAGQGFAFTPQLPVPVVLPALCDTPGDHM